MAEIRLSLSGAVAALTQAIARQSLILISEPHECPDGLTLARRIVGNVQGNQSLKVLLEAPDMFNQVRNFTGVFSNWTVQPERTFGARNANSMQVLVRLAKSNGWTVKAVDSQQLTTTARNLDPNGIVRQDYIAENVRKAFLGSTGAILTIGTKHLQGNSSNPPLFPLAKILTDQNTFSGITQYRVRVTQQYSKGILVHVIPKHAVKAYTWSNAPRQVNGINAGFGSLLDYGIRSAATSPGITGQTDWR